MPTWNYAMVQVRGTARLIEGPEFLRPQLDALTDRHEGPRADPWAVSDAPETFVASQMRGIVGLEIEVTSILGKLKLSQNRNDADREGVRAGMMDEGEPLARLMPVITSYSIHYTKLYDTPLTPKLARDSQAAPARGR